jgi:uncharacterized protein YegP (UPF0339 family)
MSRTKLLASAALIALGWLMGSIDWTSSAIAADEANAPSVQIYLDKGGDFRWRMVSAEKKVIAESSLDYSDKQLCIKDLEYVQKNIGAAKVVDVSGK